MTFEPGAITRDMGTRYWENVSPTLRANMGDNQPAVCYAYDQYNGAISDKQPTLGVNCGMSTGRNGVCYAVRTAQTNASGIGVAQGAHTLDGANAQAVCYAFDRYNGEQTGDVTQTLAGMERACNAPHICYPIDLIRESRGAFEAYEENARTSGALKQSDYKGAQVVAFSAKPPRKYIIRRLTPTECARLQGFPDAWGELAPYDGDDAFWQEVYKTSCEIKGSKYTPKKDLRKWYAGLRTDSAEYKMWGNGIALPCAEFVIRSIVFCASIE